MLTTWEKLGIEIPSGAPGPEISTTCPKCSRDRKKKNVKCLSANIVEEVFHCNHCGWGGSLKGRQGRYDSTWRKPDYRRPKEQKRSGLPKLVTDWFASRGIPATVLGAMGIGWTSVYMPQIEGETNAITFPYRRAGELVNVKYRTLDKQFRMETGAERVFYNLDSLTDAETVVICEGEIDCLSLIAADVSAACISVPDGAPAPDAKDYASKFSFVEADAKRLDTIKKIVLAVDNDKPGRRLEDELARRLGREVCYRVAWPDGCKDANDVLVKHGAAMLREVIDTAEPYPIEGVFTALGEKDRVYALYRDGHERGHKTGWPTLDSYYTVRPGELTVIIGTPGSGKTNMVDCLAVNLAELHGWGFALFSPENQPIEDHISRMVEKHLRLPFSVGPNPRMTEAELLTGLEWVEQHFWWMLPAEETAWDISWILARAKELLRRHGIRALIVDPWNELEPQRAEKESETEYVGRVLRSLRQFARRNGVHVFLVVHPQKMYRDKNGKYPIPTLWDGSGSAHFRNKADNGLCVWRDFENHEKREVDIHIQKIRFRQVGRLGKMTLTYDPATATYGDPLADERAAAEVSGRRGERERDFGF